MIKQLLSLTLLSAASMTALADARFEVFNAETVSEALLLDHNTNLLWRSPIQTYSLPLPETPQLGEWRVATFQEVAALMPVTFGEQLDITADSDIYQAASFFAGHSSVSCALPYGGCLGGMYLNQPQVGDGPSYDGFIAKFVAQPYEAGATHYLFDSTVSLGGYTQDSCLSREAMCRMGLFMVREVPEPSSGHFMAWGLIGLMGLLGRKAKSQKARPGGRRVQSTI